MPHTLLEQHAEALKLFGERLRAVADDQWDAPTPCAEWSVRDLVNHVTGEQLWIPPLVAEGRTVEELGDAFSGDVLGEDPVAAWDKASAAAHAAFAAPGALDRTVRLSYGPALGSAYCSELTADCVVHTWDLARGTGADDRLPDGLVEFSIKEVMPYADGLAASGMYAAPLEVPAGANAQTRLLGLLGRRG
ncbi:TIGR03086 family protein [Streptomyces sp. ISL-44]|uniref:TIGR03086 family metal-binding protein n=1 Tax=unclassified Streptomyces TaxID=2593676 RepID=UPI001BE9B8D9|nr:MULTISPECIES: TIGR03086 family metal-binding protein [unclassified Streptomyces]MBT2543915.1 TIGR03086 family protein [Streptomyces sp. ISL-44]MCX5010756.1 TIGR03086 family metal-binding protein [Streptomyces sp. NBC_00555]MCX5611217.1 TIGR03086 family metal-binding protein [Streptomyces sp. NBC_00047]UUU39091.1 TIGR03086 family metal-binding protein [Streptomyces sp. NBC_00162]